MSALSPTDIIRIKAPMNPKRPGTACHAHFAALRDGMTVAEYLALGAWARAELRYSLGRGHISLEPQPA